MKITSDIGNGQNNVKGNRNYPWCGIHPDYGHVVLFHKRNCGTMLFPPLVHPLRPLQHSCANKPIGHYSDSWHEGFFTPYAGKITLHCTGT